MQVPPPKNTKRLLLVDDDPNLILLVKDYLEFRGYEVITAGNGKLAWQVLAQTTPDLIICDIMMPEMDGYAFVDKLRQDSKLKFLPVIFLSAKGQTHDRIKGLNTGADIYIVKPFEPEELVAQVESSLKQTERFLDAAPKGLETEKKLEVSESVELTPTEQRVITLVAQGMGNRDIALHLEVSQRTVESHVSNMLAKTGLHNRTELARWAIETRRSN
jgi:DNA-binding NarL/FixJ family response regulator